MTTASSTDSVLERNKHLTLVLAGYREHWPFIMSISNFEGENFESPESTYIDFQEQHAALRPSTNSRKGAILVTHGMRRAITKPIERRSRTLIRRGAFSRSEAHTVPDELVSLIRAASLTPNGRASVGRSCMTVSITPNPDDNMITKYHPAEASPLQYMPHLITRHMAFKGVELEGFGAGTSVEIGWLGDASTQK